MRVWKDEAEGATAGCKDFGVSLFTHISDDGIDLLGHSRKRTYISDSLCLNLIIIVTLGHKNDRQLCLFCREFSWPTSIVVNGRQRPDHILQKSKRLPFFCINIPVLWQTKSSTFLPILAQGLLEVKMSLLPSLELQAVLVWGLLLFSGLCFVFVLFYPTPCPLSPAREHKGNPHYCQCSVSFLAF